VARHIKEPFPFGDLTQIDIGIEDISFVRERTRDDLSFWIDDAAVTSVDPNSLWFLSPEDSPAF